MLGIRRVLVLLCVACLAGTLLITAPGVAKTVLTVAPWHGMGDSNQGGMIDQLVAEYEELNPEIEIEILARMPTIEYLMKLMLMPQMADVHETHLGWFPELMHAGIPAPLPPQLDSKARDLFFAPVLQPMLHGGRLYAIPTEYQLYALGYNTHAWADAGVADPPRTWAELRQMAARGTQRHTDGSVRRIGFRFYGEGWASGGDSELHTYLSFLWGNNGTYIDETGRPGFDGIEALETLEFLTGMVRTGIAEANGWYGLDNGASFMAVIPSWSRETLLSPMGTDFSIASTLIPYNRGYHATAQYGWAFFVPSTALHPKEAWEFLDWLTMRTESSQLTRTGRAMHWLGSVPTNPHDLRYRPELHTETFWTGFIEGMNYARPEPHFPRILACYEAVGAALGPVMQLRVPPAQGLAEAQQKVAAILAP